MCTMDFHALLLLLPEAFAETPCLPSYPRLSSPDKVLHRHLKLLQLNHVKEVTRSRHTGMNKSITSKLYIVYTHNPSTREGEAAGPQVQDLLPELHRTPVCSSPPSIKKRKWGDRDPTDPGPQDQFVEEENNSTSCPLPWCTCVHMLMYVYIINKQECKKKFTTHILDMRFVPT